MTPPQMNTGPQHLPQEPLSVATLFGGKTRENASLLTGVHRANLGLRFSQTKRENDKNEVLIVNRYV